MAGRSSPQYVTIRKKLPDILDAISGAPATITQLSTLLETNNLIPKAVKTEVDSIQIGPFDKANKLISAVHTTVEFNPEAFDTFVEILYQCGLDPIATSILEEFGKLK